MTDVDQIAEGREAWARIRGHERKDWLDWLAVGRALVIGRTEALKIAQTNRPVGSRYNRTIACWLHENGLADVCAQERYRILLIIENLEAIESWRAGLDDRERRRLNHPGAIWSHWKRATKPRRQVTHYNKAKGGKIYWPQDALRRAADAMRESRSNDLFVLSRVALEAAIRDEVDLVALLEPKPTTVKPAKPMPAAMSLAL